MPETVKDLTDSDYMVNLTIDGKQVTVEEGATILKAAEKLGIEIPTFCYHDKLEAVGACRMCLVEVEKMWKLQVACATTVTEGMVVKTDSPKVKAARKGVLEFLLINHPLDCPVCDKGGECELQNLVFKYGSDKSRYAEEKRRFIVDIKSKYDDLPIGTHVVRNMNRCILCRKCVRFINEIAGEKDLGTFARAAKSEINTLPDIPLDNPYSGNVTEICPVGALTSKSFRYKIRVWQTKVTPSVCSLCGDGCNIKLWTKDDKIFRITSRRNDQVDDGFLCDKGRFEMDFVHHPERLTQPLVRKNGILQPTEWDEAIDLVASQLQAVKRRSGGNSLAGLGSPRLTNEENYLFQKLFRVVLDSNNIDHRVDSQHLLMSLDSSGKPFGMAGSIGDIEKAKVILVFGCDLEKEHPILNLRVIKSVTRGNKVYLVNPQSNRLKRFAKDELVYQKGIEVVLLSALLEELRGKIKTPNKSTASEINGATLDKIKNLALALRKADSLLILCGKEIADHPDNEDVLDLLGNLMRITGHQGKENCGVNLLWQHCNSQGALDCGVLPDRLPGYIDLADDAARKKVELIWQAQIPSQAGLDLNRMLKAISDGEMKTLYIAGVDPVGEHPNADEVRKTFEKLDFLLVQDTILTDTAKLSHVVLPGVTFAEKSGSFTNIERRVQRINKAFDPVAGSETDWKIICLIAQGMGGNFDYASPSEIFEELAKVSPVHAGMSWNDLGEAGKQSKKV